MRRVSKAGVALSPRNHDAQDDVDAFAGLPTNLLPESEAERAEVYIETLGKWLEVRTRYLGWVDGRLAQMVIATDITARRMAEEQAVAQTERAPTASRRVTTGEHDPKHPHEIKEPPTGSHTAHTAHDATLRSTPQHPTKPPP